MNQHQQNPEDAVLFPEFLLNSTLTNETWVRTQDGVRVLQTKHPALI